MEYQSENRTCQNCKNDFVIESDDFSFYEKIKVPPPTFCPECRMIRRMMWRNVRSLNKIECNLCKKTLISMYRNDSTPIFCLDCYSSDSWNQFKHAQELDINQDVFSQINNLLEKQPRQYQYRAGSVINSDYGNSIANAKNAYLSFSVIDCENVMFSENIDKCKDTVDSFCCSNLDGCYQNLSSSGNYNSKYLFSSSSCIDSMFLYNCVNCQNCLLSSNLRNGQYYFNNKKLTKEEYQKEVEGLFLNTYKGFQKAKDYFFENIFIKSKRKYAEIVSSENVTGDYISNSKNVYKSFDVSAESENIRFSNRIVKGKDLMDVSGTLSAELAYECVTPSVGTYQQIACSFCIGSKSVQYSLFLKNCSNCFGCVGLTNAQYCIFNKQYSKEEYYNLVEKIKNHMNEKPYIDSKGRVFKYGEFFPYDMCLFGYNETNAHDFFPISKEEAIDKGYNWYDREKRDYQITILSENLPDDINDIDESILKEVISCPNNGDAMSQCTSAFRIVPNELQFYKQKNLPLPRYCPNCRHYERLKYRNPIRLWHRSCMKEGCNNEFETSYAPERPEIVYCEKCYQAEVY